MSDYSQITFFTPKDALPSGNAAKVIKGTEHDGEFDAISTAIATKVDTAGSLIDVTGKTVAVDIFNGTAETTPAEGDLLGIYDASAGANRKMTLSNLLKVRTVTAGNGLSGGGTLDADISLALDINELTPQTEAVLASDLLAMEDQGSGNSVKVTPNNILKARTITTTASAGLNGGNTLDNDLSLSINQSATFDPTWLGDHTFSGLLTCGTLITGDSIAMGTDGGGDVGTVLFTDTVGEYFNWYTSGAIDSLVLSHGVGFETIAIFTKDAGTALYHNGALKFATGTDGVLVTGTCYSDNRDLHVDECRLVAYGRLNGDGAPAAVQFDFGIASVTDVGTGHWRLNLSETASNLNDIHCLANGEAGYTARMVVVEPYDTNSVTVKAYGSGGSLVDIQLWFHVYFGRSS